MKSTHTEAPISHRVVVIGAGFAGMHVFQTLQKEACAADNIRMTVIDKSDSFVFIPMIHEVATGLLQPDSITKSLRSFSHKYICDVVQGTATEIDTEKKIVTVARSEGYTDEIPYNTLVISVGAATHFFDIPGAPDYAFPLKTLADAKVLKNRIVEMFDKADDAQTEAEKEALTRFVIVGAGATGIELATELSDSLRKELPRMFPRLVHKGEIVLIDRGPRLLSEGDEWFSKKVQDAVEGRENIKVMHMTNVQKVTAAGVETDKGSVNAKTVIWCAGVHAESVPIHTTTPFVRDEKSHRISVGPNLRAIGHDDIFVLGDSALAIDAKTQKPYSMRAQFAVREGRLAAQNILARQRGEVEKPFIYQEEGFIISLGQGKAVAKVGPFRISGIVAWIFYHAAYLHAIVGTRAKLRTALEWALNLFTGRDFSKV